MIGFLLVVIDEINTWPFMNDNLCIMDKRIKNLEASDLDHWMVP